MFTSSCSDNFLIQLKTTFLGVVPPVVGWDLLHQSTVKIILRRHGPLANLILTIPQLRLCSQMNLGLVKLTAKAN